MQKQSIAFIGAGNMAASLIGGLIADGVDPVNLSASDVSDQHLHLLEERFNIRTVNDNSQLVAQADALVLAVKPQIIAEVCQEIAPLVAKNKPLIISIAAGIREQDLRRWLCDDCAIVRCMPNTPALVQSGATVLFGNQNTDEDQRDLAESILRAVGITLWVEDESLMDAVTALSGSGPAYFFLVMEAMEKAGRELGLSAETARLLTLQTALGAAKLALESDDDTAELRKKVTSPGGTTEKALAVLMEGGLGELFSKALQAAAKRSDELAIEFGAK